jgi:hypothetical protein
VVEKEDARASLREKATMSRSADTHEAAMATPPHDEICGAGRRRRP